MYYTSQREKDCKKNRVKGSYGEREIERALKERGDMPCEQYWDFIDRGQTFKFLFHAPPHKPLLWCCLLAAASRDFYPTCFDSPELPSHIPCAAAQTQAFQEAQIEIWQSLHSQNLFSPLPPPPLSHHTPLSPPPPPFVFPPHINRYNQDSVQMFFLYDLQMLGDTCRADGARCQCGDFSEMDRRQLSF